MPEENKAKEVRLEGENGKRHSQSRRRDFSSRRQGLKATGEEAKTGEPSRKHRRENEVGSEGEKRRERRSPRERSQRRNNGFKTNPRQDKEPENLKIATASETEGQPLNPVAENAKRGEHGARRQHQRTERGARHERKRQNEWAERTERPAASELPEGQEVSEPVLVDQMLSERELTADDMARDNSRLIREIELDIAALSGLHL